VVNIERYAMVNYSVFSNLVGKTNVEIDAKTLKRLQDIQSLNDLDKAHIFELLDAFLRDRKTKKAYAS
jgi:hypothetical protein